MIKDCLEVFEKKLLEEGIEFILEDYRHYQIVHI